MTNKKQQLVDDVCFIFSECARLHAEWVEGKLPTVNSPEAWELLCTIPHPLHPSSFQTCGRKAYERLDTLAQVAVNRAGIAGTVYIPNVRKELSEIIVRKFQKERMPINEKNVDRALSETGRQSKKLTHDAIHLIPCHLMISRHSQKFKIGPVTFYSQKYFRSNIISFIKNDKENYISQSKQFRSSFQYYRNFGWVAEVMIPTCDNETSESIAIQTIQSAIDFLHLIFGPGHTNNMTIGGPSIQVDAQARLSVVSEKLSYKYSRRLAGEVGFPDNWIDRIEEPHLAPLFNLCGIALECAANPSLTRPISRRFLDAARWFGEAVRENSSASKVVKYVTSLERLLMTEEMDNISEVVSLRAAAMCFQMPSRQSFEEFKADTKKAYALRSRLVHGSMSHSSSEIGEGVRLGAKISENALHSALSNFGENGLRAENVSNKKLAEWYNGVVRYAQDRLEPAA